MQRRAHRRAEENAIGVRGCDAEVVTYREILEIFYRNDEQRDIANVVIEAADAAGMFPGRPLTQVSPVGPFWPAPAPDQQNLATSPHKADQIRA